MNSKLTGEGDDDEEEEVKKRIAFFDYKQRLLHVLQVCKFASL